jgi:SAM-dependent methyltransferase
MGRSAHERARLARQAALLAPFTTRLFAAAGLAPGMRVLDVGCGVGDVALLAAARVGPAGAVVGVDRDPAVLAVARGRAAAAGLAHLTFVEGDFRALPPAALGGPVDALVGRYVLLYQADPAAALRAAAAHLRPGGVVALHEPDFGHLEALPPAPLYARIADWWWRTGTAAGLELRMGLKLFAAVAAAGLPAPQLLAEPRLGGGPDFVGYAYLEDVIRSILPLMERFGVGTAAEVDVDTLGARLRAAVVGGGGVVALQTDVGAWTRRPG